MGERIDVTEAGHTAEARALLDRLAGSEVISLGVFVRGRAVRAGRDQAPGLLGGASRRCSCRPRTS